MFLNTILLHFCLVSFQFLNFLIFGTQILVRILKLNKIDLIASLFISADGLVSATLLWRIRELSILIKFFLFTIFIPLLTYINTYRVLQRGIPLRSLFGSLALLCLPYFSRLNFCQKQHFPLLIIYLFKPFHYLSFKLLINNLYRRKTICILLYVLELNIGDKFLNHVLLF